MIRLLSLLAVLLSLTACGDDSPAAPSSPGVGLVQNATSSGLPTVVEFGAGTLSSSTGAPGIVEQWVQWLGQQSPTLFLATGFCENKELDILGLSLANWSFLAYGALLAGSAALIQFTWNERKSS